MTEKNSPEFYGEEYLKGVIGNAGGATRGEDNGAYYTSAVFISRFLKESGISNAKTLDVGAGLGFIVRHLRNLKIDAHGCEYGHFPEDRYVVDGIVWADLTEGLPYEDDSFDLISCHGVLSQFPAEYAEGAVRELYRVSRRFLWTNIQILPHELQAYHKNIAPAKFWRSIFRKAGFKPVAEEFMRKTYPGTKYNFMAIWEKVRT